MSKLKELVDEVLRLDNNATRGPWEADLGNWQIESKNEESYRDGICSFAPMDRDGTDGDFNKIDPINDAFLISRYRISAPKLAKVCLLMQSFIKGKLTCLGERHDCPSCNGQDAEDTLEEIEVILGEEG